MSGVDVEGDGEIVVTSMRDQRLIYYFIHDDIQSSVALILLFMYALPLVDADCYEFHNVVGHFKGRS